MCCTSSVSWLVTDANQLLTPPTVTIPRCLGCTWHNWATAEGGGGLWSQRLWRVSSSQRGLPAQGKQSWELKMLLQLQLHLPGSTRSPDSQQVFFFSRVAVKTLSQMSSACCLIKDAAGVETPLASRAAAFQSLYLFYSVRAGSLFLCKCSAGLLLSLMNVYEYTLTHNCGPTGWVIKPNRLRSKCVFMVCWLGKHFNMKGNFDATTTECFTAGECTCVLCYIFPFTS